MLGENLQIEWDKESKPDKLWDALQSLKQDSLSGLAQLRELSDSGSSLAMMYLGSYLLKTDALSLSERELGKELLETAFHNGSNEAGYQLSKYLMLSGDYSKGTNLLHALCERQFSPAAYFLGWIFYRGELAPRNIDKALEFLNFAADLGHLQAINLRSKIKIKHFKGFNDLLSGMVDKVMVVIPFTICALVNTNSDRLRF